ncbi:MAG: metallophosphoesterase, partial [Clostridia bacterium]
MILINAMTKKYPCYYVSGNHEYWTSGIPKIKSELRNAGVIVLEGDCKTLKIDTQYINICGVDDPTYIGKYATVEQIKTVDAAADNKLFTILLSHRPELFDEYAKCDFDLVLSGHAHGGQWRIPGILNGLYAPGQGLFPKHAGGQYAMGDNLMIVSRGLARGGNVIPRIFNRPELVIIDLMQK